jgi:hypothetical protein
MTSLICREQPDNKGEIPFNTSRAPSPDVTEASETLIDLPRPRSVSRSFEMKFSSSSSAEAPHQEGIQNGKHLGQLSLVMQPHLII